MSALILVASVLGLLFGVVYTLFKPRWAILFIIVLYPLEQLLTTASSFFVSNSKFLNLLVGGLAVIGSGSALFSGRRPFRGYFNGLWFATIALYIYGVFGIAFAPDKQPGIDELILAIPYLGLLLVFPALLINNLEDFRKLVVPTMIVGTVIIILILLSPKTSMFGGRLGIENTGVGRDSAEILNPLATAGLGGTIVIFGMLYRPAAGATVINIIRAVAIAVGLIIALLSGSRGQLLGAVFCGVVMFPFARQIKNMVQFITVSASAFIGMVFVMLVINFATTRDAASRWSASALTQGMGSREEMATTMLSEWIGNPAAIIQGLGTSSFDFYWNISDAPYVHNMPVQIVTENGLVGLLLLSIILIVGTRMSFVLLRSCKDHPRELSTAAVLVAYCMYQFILSLKQGNWFSSGAPFWTLLILAKLQKRATLDGFESHQLESLTETYASDPDPEYA